MPSSTRRSASGKTRSKPCSASSASVQTERRRSCRSSARSLSRSSSIAVRDARRREELRVDARRGEAGDRVQLVHEHLAVVTDEHVDPRHALAFGGDERARRRAPARARLRVRDSRRHDQLHLALVVLGRVVVPLVVVTAISPGSEAIGSRFPSTPTSTSIPETNSSTSTFSSCVERKLDRSRELRVVVRLRDPDRGAEPRRLHEHRDSGNGFRAASPGPQGDVASHRDAVVAQDGLEEILVHAERRGGDARADVGDACELEQALHAFRPRRMGPCSTGKTTSTSASVRADASSRAGARASARRRRRAPAPTPRRAPRARHGRSRSSTTVAPGSVERLDRRCARRRARSSCSLERPPSKTATRRLKASRWSGSSSVSSSALRCGVVVVVAVVVDVVVGRRRRSSSSTRCWSTS